jgi:hypothetical protein
MIMIPKPPKTNSSKQHHIAVRMTAAVSNGSLAQPQGGLNSKKSNPGLRFLCDGLNQSCFLIQRKWGEV